MSDSKSLGDWMQDWEALQRQYMNAWSEIMAKAPGASMPAANPFATAVPGASVFGTPPFGAASPFAANPFGASPFAAAAGAGFGQHPGWPEGFERWSKMVAEASQGKQSDTIERLRSSASSYLSMIQSIFGAAAAQQAGMGAQPSNPMQAWLESLRSVAAPQGGFGMPGMDASSLNNPFTKALRDMAGQGAKGFTEMPAAFAPFVEQLKRDGMSWLKLPAFGVGREHQEHYQKTALAFAEYGQALQNYNALMSQASQRGFELFEVKLTERGESLRSIESLRALYDLWVDSAEEAYAEIALSEEFAKVYGELANAQMRARAQVQAEVERVSTDLGMPTRSELNSLHKRVHDLRRELRDGNQTHVDTSHLEVQIVALRAEVAQLKQSLSRARKDRVVASNPADTTDKKGSAPVKPTSVSTNDEKGAATATRIASPDIATSIQHADAQRRVRVSPTRARVPAPVVRPRPPAVESGKTAAGTASFGDAIAAMRRRVSGKAGKYKSVNAGMSKPTKRNESDEQRKKARKRKK